MAIGDTLDVEFFLKRRIPWAWTLLESTFRKHRLAQAKIRCNNSLKKSHPLAPGIRGYCVFAGFPRSGHSVVGALLNAHNNILISHNLDALEYLRNGFSRDELFFLIKERNDLFAANGYTAGGYCYAIPGVNRDCQQAVHIIGDKRAGTTSRHLLADPKLLRRLPSLLDLPVYLIVHFRNPWDNISSIFNRADIRRGRSIKELIEWYFWLLDGTCAAIDNCGPDLHIIQSHHEQLLQYPEAVIRRILDTFGLTGDNYYYAVCKAFVHPLPRHSRQTVPWTKDLIEQVAHRAADYPMLAHYSFDE